MPYKRMESSSAGPNLMKALAQYWMLRDPGSRGRLASARFWSSCSWTERGWRPVDNRIVSSQKGSNASPFTGYAKVADNDCFWISQWKTCAPLLFFFPNIKGQPQRLFLPSGINALQRGQSGRRNVLVWWWDKVDELWLRAKNLNLVDQSVRTYLDGTTT